MTDRILFVTGLGRCGTTMVMQMLHAAGVPCAGSPPAFEDVPVAPSGVDHEWLARQGGRAVKWIDPTVTRVRRDGDAAIFLARDPAQQAKSVAKLLGVALNRADRRRLTASVSSDTIRARRIVERQFGAENVLSLYFERIIDAPLVAAFQLKGWCDTVGLPFGDPKRAASAVLRRSPACAPDLSVELGMMRRSG